MTGARLDRLAWPEVAHRPVLLVPVGSTEQHGPHLPTGTDTRVAQEVADGVAAAVAGGGLATVVAPAVSYGASGEHEHFAGTLSIGHEALEALIVELARSATRWTDRVLLVNGHGGNVPAVRRAVVRLRSEGRDVAWVTCSRPGADAHAGAFETSLMLALAPGSVRAGKVGRGVTDPLERLMPRLRAEGVRAVSATGVLGDPTAAVAADGRVAYTAMVADVTGLLTRWTPDADGRLRP